MQKQILLPLFLLFISQYIFAQSEAIFRKQQQTIPFQKIYLHTDREFYFVGDTLWFSGYLLHPKTHAPIKTNCNLYVELLDENSDFIKKKLFPVSEGFCPGQILLNSPALKEGNYVLRAFTDLLGAYGDDYFFSKAIRISPVKTIVETNNKKSIITKVNIDLFPEGGFLLAGKYNQMAFKITDQNGRAVQSKGRLLDENNNVIQKFSTDYEGMGITHFVSEAGKEYKLEIDGFANIEYTFPEIRETGAKIMLTRLSPKGAEVEVITNNQNSSQKYYVVSMHRGEINSIATIKGKDKSITIKPKLLNHGINRLLLLNKNFEPLSERLIFANKNEEIRLKVILNKNTFTFREEVELGIERPDNLSKDESLHLSVSVIDAYSMQNNSVSQNIKSYLLADSELKGFISNPADYFINDTEISSAQKLNLLMLTQGWRNYIWNELSEIKEPPAYETNFGVKITGTVKNSFGRKPLVDSEVILSVAEGDKAFLDFTQTDSLGRYRFSNVQYYDSANVMVQGLNKRDRTNTNITLDSIRFNSPQFTTTERWMMKHFSEVPLELYRTKYENESKLKAFYPDRNTRVLKEIEVNAPKIIKEMNNGRFRPYVEPTYTVKVKETHYAIPDVVEFMQGRIPGFERLMGKNSRNEEALFLIDGIEVNVPDRYANSGGILRSIPMMDIARIEVLKFGETVLYGSRGAAGVVNIILKDGSEYTPPIDALRGTIVKRLQGFSKYREFYSPKYTNENINTEAPDFRTTLYWNPEINMGKAPKNISFFTCDNTTRYKVFVEGISDKGRICLDEAEFEVNKDGNLETNVSEQANTESVDSSGEPIENKKAKHFIKGSIKNNANEAIAFASLYNTSKNTSCITDNLGNFKLEANVGDNIKVQHLNYESHSFIANNTNPNCILPEKGFLLDEVLVSAAFAAKLYDKSCRNTFAKFKSENIFRAYSQIIRTDDSNTTQVIDIDLDIFHKKRKKFKRGEKVAMYVIQEKNVIDSSIVGESFELKICDFYPKVNWVRFNENFTYTKTEGPEYITLYFRPKKMFINSICVTEVIINKQDTTLSSVAIIDKNPVRVEMQSHLEKYTSHNYSEDYQLALNKSIHYFKYGYTNSYSYLSECFYEFDMFITKPVYKPITLQQYLKTYNNGSKKVLKRPEIKRLAGNKLGLINFKNYYSPKFLEIKDSLGNFHKNFDYMITQKKISLRQNNYR